jgi:nitric oxide reductase NorD protein
MAEAEDVITDAARHATVFTRALWRRYRPPAEIPATVCLSDISQRLDLLITAVFGAGLRLRVAQPPPHPTLLQL